MWGPHGSLTYAPQVKPPPWAPQELAPRGLPGEALAKVDTSRSELSLPHAGQATPSLVAPIRCRREKTWPHSLQRYS